MSAQKLIIMRIALNLARLGTAGRATLASLVAKFAPQSTIYQTVPSIKELADKVIASGADAAAKQKEVEIKKKAYLASVVDRDTADQQLASDLAAYKGAAGGACKTAKDVESLGLRAAAPSSAPVALTAPTQVTAIPGKEKGSFTSRAKRVPGLHKYIVEVSPEAMTPGSFQHVAGTSVKRSFSGYESGKGYWLRYCTERGQERSAWSEPVYVVAR